eukprot:c29182_g3_i1 orf=209-478(-)
MSPASMPPGFRFYPTDEELLGYYLKRKTLQGRFEHDVIAELDLYKHEPWDLPDYKSENTGSTDGICDSCGTCMVSLLGPRAVTASLERF